ncbi:hypothetical protein CHH28_13065 [Bacterioplanes sanyensis]|uniref:histidine kinase n=1 Tax=Bacterioplanes sanyensis TaxID=1249553 RepID=A0A222FKK8_9GAMM|nr:response regulator [Bacterioplanes sanyensis]ASP39548.1 hypothetical protein CHH28_13065 [Bacterioplanes sanyensis]
MRTSSSAVLTDSSTRGARYRFLQNMVIAIVVAGVMLLGLEHYNFTEVRKRLFADMTSEQQQGQALLENYLRRQFDYLNFIHATPPIAALVRSSINAGIDHDSGSTQQQWQQRLEQILTAFMANHREIRSIQYTAISGQTLAAAGRSEQVLPSMSQPHTDDLQALRALKPGQFYVSPLHLARRQGQVEYPIWPAMTLALGVYQPDTQELFGILSFTLDATAWLSELRASVKEPFASVLTTVDGKFLLHPRQQLEFAHELGQAHSWQQLNGEPTQVNTNIRQFNAGALTLYATQSRIALGSPALGHDVILRTTLTEDDLWREVERRRGDTLITAAILVALLLIFMTGYQRYVSARLRWLSAQAKFQTIVDHSMDAIITLDAHGHINGCNRATEQLFGQRAATMLGRSLQSTLLSADHAADDSHQGINKHADSNVESNIESTADDIEPLQRAIQQRRSVTFSALGRFADNTFPLDLSVVPIVTDHGECTGYSVTARDRSQQELLTQQLQQRYQQQLSDTEEQLRSVQQSLADARRQTKNKERLLAAISHEIRTPMNSIQGVLSLLAKSRLGADQQRYLDMASDSMRSVAALMDDILDYSKLRSGQLFVEEVEFSLMASLHSALTHYASSAFDKGLTLLIDNTRLQHDRLRGDPTRIRQVLGNLLANAIKTTRHGYVLVEISSSEDNDYGIHLQGRVSDSGIGVEEQHTRALSQFEELEDVSFESVGGPGLGLALSRQLCVLMGGDLRICPREEHGGCFEFQLLASPATSGSKNPLHDDSGLSSSRWLLSLDDGLQADVLMRMIQQRGGRVDIARRDSDLDDYHIVLTDAHHLRDYADALQSSQHANIITLVPPAGAAQPIPASLSVIKLPLPVTQEALALAYLQATDDHPAQAILSANSHLTEERRFQQQRILVVDDDEVNLEVIATLLTDMGLRCDRAIHGGAAIDKLLNSEAFDPYLLILMDCQMPLLDGYQATRQIRQGEAGERYEQIPVIAVTAAALPQDRQRCISAGMNDYIAKPMAADQLRHLLTQWLDSQPAAALQSSPPSNLSVEQLSDWNKTAALHRLNNNPSLLTRVLALFRDKADAQLMTADIAPDTDSSALAELATMAHTLKGASANAGAEQLSHYLGHLQVALVQQNTDEAQTLLEQAKQAFHRFTDAVDADLSLEPWT